MASFSEEDRKGSGKKLKVHFDLPEDEKEKHSSSSISSQSSLDSNDHNIENFEESNNIVGYGSPVWSFQSGTVTQSPTPQLMSPNPNSPNPNSGYDPNRIPSSAFAPKPTSPMDWSVQSNESLFSLHLGNYSFSREQFFAYKYSGELSKTNNDNAGLSPTLPRVQEVKHSNDENIVEIGRHSVSSDSSHDSTDTSDKTKNLTLENDQIKTSNENVDLVLKDDDLVKTETSVNVEKNTLDKIQDDHSKATAVPTKEPTNYAATSIVSWRSVESDMSSNHSFQFPILTPEGLRTSSIESEMHDNNEKQHYQQQQQMQQSEKPMQPPSPKSETTPKLSSRSWCCCSCFSCSPCF